MKKTTSLMTAFVLAAGLGLSGCGMTTGSLNPFGDEKSEQQQNESSGPLVMPGEIDEEEQGQQESERETSGDKRILISESGPSDDESGDQRGSEESRTEESRSSGPLIQPELTDSKRAAQLAAEGHEAYRSGDFQEAINKYQKASRLDPSKAEYQINIGSLHFNQKNYEKAASRYRRALSVNPDSAEAHLYLGATLLRTGDRSTARRHLKKAVELDPGNEQAQRLLDRSGN